MKKLIILLAISLTSQIFAVDTQSAFDKTMDSLKNALREAGVYRGGSYFAKNQDQEKRYTDNYNLEIKRAKGLEDELRQICNVK